MSQNLQQKNTKYLFIRLLLVLLASSVLFYLFMRLHGRHMQRKELQLRQSDIRDAFIAAPVSMPRHISGEYDIVEGNQVPPDQLNTLRDTAFFYAGKNKWLPFKTMTAEFGLQGKAYQVTTYISSTEVDHLIIKVIATELGIFALLFVTIIYINRKTSGALWMPFRSTMKKLNEYDITQNQVPDLPSQTGITEFNELNIAVSSLISRANQAYRHQKQFVENASHEMQTPLAIIRSKLELLINQPRITAETAALLGDITEASERLSQLNRSLLLLAKIENNQFPDKDPVNVSALLETVVATYQQHYEDAFPSITRSVIPDIYVTANYSLIEILISNLLKNAIVHNTSNGYIRIDLVPGSLTITNTGRPLTVAPARLFERFRKGNDEIKSTGLGLALVKQICQLYHFRIDYQYQDGIHTVAVHFQDTSE